MLSTLLHRLAVIVLLALAVAGLWRSLSGVQSGGLALAQSGLAPFSQDEGSASLCRSIIAVVNPAGTTVDNLTMLRLGDARAVIISYAAQPPGGIPRSRKIVCSYTDPPAGPRRMRELSSVTLDGVTLGPARFQFLKRFWVGSAEADAAAQALSARKGR